MKNNNLTENKPQKRQETMYENCESKKNRKK